MCVYVYMYVGKHVYTCVVYDVCDVFVVCVAHYVCDVCVVFVCALVYVSTCVMCVVCMI